MPNDIPRLHEPTPSAPRASKRLAYWRFGSVRTSSSSTLAASPRRRSGASIRRSQKKFTLHLSTSGAAKRIARAGELHVARPPRATRDRHSGYELRVLAHDSGE